MKIGNNQEIVHRSVSSRYVLPSRQDKRWISSYCHSRFVTVFIYLYRNDKMLSLISCLLDNLSNADTSKVLPKALNYHVYVCIEC